MTGAGMHLCDHTSSGIMFRSITAAFLSNGITVTGTQQVESPFPLKQTYVASHLHEMRRLHRHITALPVFNSWLCAATRCNSNSI